MRMSKTTVVLFEGNFFSNTDGTARRYWLSSFGETARKAVGGAAQVRVSLEMPQRTPNAKLKLYLFETGLSRLPSALDPSYQAFFTSPDLTTAFPQPFNIVGPFADNVDLALDVSASSGTQLEQATARIVGTLFTYA